MEVVLVNVPKLECMIFRRGGKSCADDTDIYLLVWNKCHFIPAVMVGLEREASLQGLASIGRVHFAALLEV